MGGWLERADTVIEDGRTIGVGWTVNFAAGELDEDVHGLVPETCGRSRGPKRRDREGSAPIVFHANFTARSSIFAVTWGCPSFDGLVKRDRDLPVAAFRGSGEMLGHSLFAAPAAADGFVDSRVGQHCWP